MRDGVGHPRRIGHAAGDLVRDTTVRPEEGRVAGQSDARLVDVGRVGRVAVRAPGVDRGQPQRPSPADHLGLGGDLVHRPHVDAALVDGPPVDHRVGDRLLEQPGPGEVPEGGDVTGGHVIDDAELQIVLRVHADHLRYLGPFVT
jgi:hypothetical protein